GIRDFHVTGVQTCALPISVHNASCGEPVGYGAQFISKRPTRIGVVAMGYADGYPRHAKNGTPVLVDNQRTDLIGRVSMDMLTVEIGRASCRERVQITHVAT